MRYTVITGELTTRTALHIGSGDSSNLADSLLRRDSAGEPLIPGTAIAGVLRSLLIRLAPRLGHNSCLSLKHVGNAQGLQPCDCPVCELMGSSTIMADYHKEMHNSRVLVFNAQIMERQPWGAVRDGVGINRSTGAAAYHAKYNYEILPAGTKFSLRMELKPDAEDLLKLLAAALLEWEAGRLWLGADSARGLGGMKLDNLKFNTLELGVKDNLINFLKSDKPWQDTASEEKGWLEEQRKKISVLSSNEEEKDQFFAATWLEINGVLEAEGPLLTSDMASAGATGFDHAPLTRRCGDWQNPVIGGASLRGVIRSHGERIIRTLATLQAVEQKGIQPQDWFLERCPACDPLAQRNKDEKIPLESCASLHGGRNTEQRDQKPDLCLACQLFGSTLQGSRLRVEDATFKGDKPKYKILDFLAIDRFTGGGMDQAKFDAMVLWKPKFSFRMFLENPMPWELGWLALILRDMESGWLRVGMGASKGFGKVKLRNLDATLGYLHPDDLKRFGLSPDAEPEINGLFKTKKISLAEQDKWLQEFHEKVNQFQRNSENNNLPPLETDSYFNDQKIYELYASSGELS